MHGSAKRGQNPVALFDDTQQKVEDGKDRDQKIQSIFAPSHGASGNQVSYATQNEYGKTQGWAGFTPE
jgi:hypothetical protein